jgi:hypothetical protein
MSARETVGRLFAGGIGCLGVACTNDQGVRLLNIAHKALATAEWAGHARQFDSMYSCVGDYFTTESIIINHFGAVKDANQPEGII